MHPALDRWYCREAFHLTSEMLAHERRFDHETALHVFGAFLSFFSNQKRENPDI